VAYAAVEIGKQCRGFGSRESGLTIRASKGIYRGQKVITMISTVFSVARVRTDEVT
jgi:hypothetical protein